LSIRHNDKCTRQQADDFLKDVREWCAINRIPVKKFIALTAYEGGIRLHNGQCETRASKKRVMQKDDVGYFLAKTIITKPSYTSVFRDEWYNSDYQEEEKQAIREFFKEDI
jgi:hypothetical protein